MTDIKTRSRLAVPDISCAQCKASIEAAVASLRGVSAVAVDLADRTVTVDHDPALAPRHALVEAIDGAGYEVAEDREEALR